MTRRASTSRRVIRRDDDVDVETASSCGLDLDGDVVDRIIESYGHGESREEVKVEGMDAA